MNTQNVRQRAAGWTRSVSLGFAAAIIGVTAIVGTASAASTRPLQKATVNYHDLNLSQQKDVTVLYQRIRNAARQVCVAVDSKRLSAKAKFDECRAAAIQAAIKDIAVPALIEHHNARVGAGSANLVLSSR
jgi:UrcA family protein